MGAGALAYISDHLTDEVCDKTAMTSLRLLAVLNVPSSTPQFDSSRAPSGSRLVLTAFSRTSPPHVVRNAGWPEVRWVGVGQLAYGRPVARSPALGESEWQAGAPECCPQRSLGMQADQVGRNPALAVDDDGGGDGPDPVLVGYPAALVH